MLRNSRWFCYHCHTHEGVIVGSGIPRCRKGHQMWELKKVCVKFLCSHAIGDRSFEISRKNPATTKLPVNRRHREEIAHKRRPRKKARWSGGILEATEKDKRSPLWPRKTYL